MKDYYSILGLPRKATDDDIKKAYRTMAKKWHPDKNKESNAEERFKEISQAYNTLGDRDKKRIYDMQHDANNNCSSTWDANGNSSDAYSTKKEKTSRGFKFTFSPKDSNSQDTNGAGGPRPGQRQGGRARSRGRSSSFRFFSRPDWSDTWNNDSDDDDTFKAFKNDFFDIESFFEDFFNDPFFNTPPFASYRSSFRSDRQKPRTKRPSGLWSDEEDLMYDWSKPPWSRDTNMDDEEDLSSTSTLLLACGYCGRRFTPTALNKHKAQCKKMAEENDTRGQRWRTDNKNERNTRHRTQSTPRSEKSPSSSRQYDDESPKASPSSSYKPTSKDTGGSRTSRPRTTRSTYEPSFSSGLKGQGYRQGQSRYTHQPM